MDVSSAGSVVEFSRPPLYVDLGSSVTRQKLSGGRLREILYLVLIVEPATPDPPPSPRTDINPLFVSSPPLDKGITTPPLIVTAFQWRVIPPYAPDAQLNPRAAPRLIYVHSEYNKLISEPLRLSLLPKGSFTRQLANKNAHITIPTPYYQDSLHSGYPLWANFFIT
jgi:hypothetical protein